MKSLYHGEWRRDLGPFCSSRSYQLECSSRLQPPHTMRHLAKPSLFATIWLTFRHAQKQGGAAWSGWNLSNTSVPVSTFVNFWEYLLGGGGGGVLALLVSRRRIAQACLLCTVSGSPGAGGGCWHEQRLTSTCDRWNVVFLFFFYMGGGLVEKWRYVSDNGRQGARRLVQNHQNSLRAALVYIWRA